MNWLPEVVVWTSSLVVAGLYYRSGSQKLYNPYAFREILRQYQLLPEWSLNWVGPSLTVAELLAALWLLLPWTRLLGAGLGAALQILFLTATALRLGTHFPDGCGCFELNIPKEVTWRNLAINAVVLAALVTVIRLQ
jgi:hypothetical protein